VSIPQVAVNIRLSAGFPDQRRGRCRPFNDAVNLTRPSTTSAALDFGARPFAVPRSETMRDGAGDATTLPQHMASQPPACRRRLLPLRPLRPSFADRARPPAIRAAK